MANTTTKPSVNLEAYKKKLLEEKKKNPEAFKKKYGGKQPKVQK